MAYYTIRLLPSAQAAIPVKLYGTLPITHNEAGPTREAHLSTHSQPHLPRAAAAQRGATLIFTAFVLLMLVATLGLAVEVGRLYAAQTELQKTANIAALDAARAALGCGGQAANPQDLAQEAAKRARDRAYATAPEGVLPSVETVLGAATDRNHDDIREFEDNASVSANPPDVTGDGRPDDVTLTAVQVTLTRPPPPLLLSIFPVANTLTATAAAQSIPQASFRLGSSLLTANAGVLGALGIDVGVFDQGSLVDTDIFLGELAVELGLITTEDLLTEGLPLEELLTTSFPTQELISAVNAVADDALGGLEDALAADLGNQPVTLGDVLAAGGPLGRTAQVNAAALANALVQAAQANRAEPIDLPLEVNLLGLTNVTAQVRILEPPIIAIGRPGLNGGVPRTQAHSGQILVQLNLMLDIDLGAASLEGQLPLYILAGRARAQLDDIFCATALQRFHEVAISAEASTADVGVGRYNLTATNPTLVAEGGNLDLDALIGLIPILGVDVEAGPITAGGASIDPLRDGMGRLFQKPTAPGADNRIAISAGLAPGSAIEDLLTTLEVRIDPNSLLGLGVLVAPLVNILLGDVQGLLQPAVVSLLQALALDDTLNNLLSTLGVNLGGGEVTLESVSVDQPALFES